MAKPIQVQISFIAGQVKRLLDYGRTHRMHCGTGALLKGTIAKKIIVFMLSLYGRKDVREHLQKHGGTLHDLVDRSLTQYIASKRR